MKIQPKYKHLTQKKNFCGIACVQMILFRRDFWVDQELLAYKLGAKIDEKDRDLYRFSFKELPSDNPDIGIRIMDFKKKKVKNFFQKYKLRVEVHLISEIDNVENFIIMNLKNNNDVIINFWWKPIKDIDFGHHVLLSGFDTKSKIVTACDPSPQNKSFWKVELNKLIKGMSSKWTGYERGFIVIKK